MQINFPKACGIRVWPLSNWTAWKVSVAIWNFPCEESVFYLPARLDKESSQWGRFQIMWKQRRVSRWASWENWENCHPPHLTTAIVTIQLPKDTARPINLPHYHCYRPSARKDSRRWETGWGSGVDGGSWMLMGGCVVEGRNKSAEWKIRKRNLSHHCWLPLSRCMRSMDSQGETCLSAQLLHLFKWDSQLHEVKPHFFSLCSSATTVHVWMKGGRRRVETERVQFELIWGRETE